MQSPPTMGARSGFTATAIVIIFPYHATQESPRMKKISVIVLSALLTGPVTVFADEVTVPFHRLTDTGTGESIGTVTFADSSNGLDIRPDLKGLEPGIHGFHVHQNADCSPGTKEGKVVPGLAAGGHFDPGSAGMHAGPAGFGHLGDMPALEVTADGSAATATTAPRLTVADIRGHAIIIHAGGDNYSDQPKKLGGGGARVACGIVQ
jgi:Cu-Zn family superoxide dismutase